VRGLEKLNVPYKLKWKSKNGKWRRFWSFHRRQ
jgi:hypothetical protein